jgi:hypothetical protein
MRFFRCREQERFSGKTSTRALDLPGDVPRHGVDVTPDVPKHRPSARDKVVLTSSVLSKDVERRVRLEAVHLERELDFRVGEVDPADEHAPLAHRVLRDRTRDAVGAEQRSHPSLEDASRTRGVAPFVEETTESTDAGASLARQSIERRSDPGHRRHAAANRAVTRPRHSPEPCDRTEVDKRPLDDGARNAVDRRDPPEIQIGDAVHDDAGRHWPLGSSDGDLDETNVGVDESRESGGRSM